MKIFASVCAGIALIASIVAVSSWMELRKQREVNAASRERQIEVPLPASLPAAPLPATTVAAATPPDTPISRKEPSILEKNLQVIREVVKPERQREMLKDPNFRKGVRWQILQASRHNYPDLARELGLSQDEADRVFDLLADDGLARMEERLNRGDPKVDATEAERTQRNFDRQLEESVRIQLGDKYPQWQAYQPTRPTRVLVFSMSEQLIGTGTPLSAEQYKTLTTAWIANAQPQAEEEKVMPQNPPVKPDPTDPVYRARKEENTRRMLEVSAPYVDATQLAAMRKIMERDTFIEMVNRRQAQGWKVPAQ